MTSLSARRPARGIALISTLAIIAIVTVMLVSFVSVVNQDRSATQNYSQGLRADQVARGGLDTIVDLLRQEVTDQQLNDYTNSPGTSYAMYAATNLTHATNAFPQHNGPAGFPTIIAYSGTNIFQTTSTNAAIPAAEAYVTNASLNGRSISASRWNQSYMVTNTENFPAVQWTLVTRSGAGTTAPSLQVATNNVLSNDQFVVGRYAYVIYDTSGLLDINVAGNPVASGTVVPKGTMPWADLTALTNSITSADVQKLVQWRNPTTATDSNAYAAYITNTWATNGFMRVASGDNAFLSRQDLIRYVTSQNSNLTAALPYLTTFSRAVNGPTWGPRINGSGAAYQYLANQVATSTVNPLVFKTTVQTSFTRNNGVAAHVGEPLMMYRFPLSKLALVETGTDTSNIQRYFGLDKVADSTTNFRHWAYPTASGTFKHTAGTILTLDAVAALVPAREPDFFELLKAGIYAGSIGLPGRGDSLTDGGAVDIDIYPDNQVIQIGLNIIDQWDADDYPTTITFGNLDLYGVEDLPYIEQIFCNFDMTQYPNVMFGCYYFNLWNPYQPRSSGGSTQKLRLTVLSSSRSAVAYPWGVAPTSANSYNADFWNQQLSTGAYRTPLLDGMGTFNITSYSTGGSAYRLSTLLAGATATQGVTAGFAMNPAYKGSVDAIQITNNFPIGYDGVLTSITQTASSTTKTPTAVYMTFDMAQFAMQFADGATYHTYGTFVGYFSSAGGNAGGYLGGITNPGNQAWMVQLLAPAALGQDRNFVKSDPRTRRWGGYFSTGLMGPTASTVPDMLLPSGLVTNKVTQVVVNVNAQFGLNPSPIAGTPPGYDVITKWQSNTNTPSYASPGYYDVDMVQRPGDNAAATTLVTPTTAAAAGDTHPVILNRAFNSVAELGYVFRDEPWKSLDFVSAKSGDAGLLDLFTMADAPVVAGVVNPNTPYSGVLAALLAGTSYGPGVTTPMSVSAAQTLAEAITGQLSNNPVMNRGDLPAAFATNTLISSLLNGVGTGAQAKTQREAAIRALADVSNTRTWNIMVDIIAQSGRYPTTAKTLDNFTVTGERRYWLHIAIDRYTGQIVDEMLEKVGD